MKILRRILYRIGVGISTYLIGYAIAHLVDKYFPSYKLHLVVVAAGFMIYVLFKAWKNRRPFYVSFGKMDAFTKMADEFRESSGFQCDQLLVGLPASLMFDTTDERLAFVSPDSIVEYPYGYILAWAYTRIGEDKATAVHRILLRLNDVNRPVLLIVPGCGSKAGTAAEADFWAAKLESLLGRATPDPGAKQDY